MIPSCKDMPHGRLLLAPDPRASTCNPYLIYRLPFLTRHTTAMTGAGVVIFNDVIHVIRSSIWQSTPVDASGWAYWARDLPISARWNTLLLPPAMGGLAVGLLRKLSGGFDNPPHEPQQSQAAAQGAQQNSRASSQPLSVSAALPAQQDRAPVANSATSESTKGSPSSERVDSSQEASTSSSSNTVWSLPWLTSGSRSLKRRIMRVLRPILKASAAAITLGTGNSLGPEGPSVEIGRAASRGLGTVLKSKQRRLLSLVAAGSGAGDCRPQSGLSSSPSSCLPVGHVAALCILFRL